MGKLLLIFAGCLSITALFGGSVRLLNDSNFKLHAVVRGADGSYLGELVIDPQKTSTWTDSNTQFGIYDRQREESVTPYTVMWHCLDGGEYSICTNVANGATVSAQSCDGIRDCKPIPKRKPINPNQGKGEELMPPPPEEQQGIPAYPSQ
ncbi:MAG TPA: hypothetical protein VLG76_00615 [Rhabdochlamydiaceae bacterium]|nr:hypothetical protein [Rhabdochlamydiaceae bacterium]